MFVISSSSDVNGPQCLPPSHDSHNDDDDDDDDDDVRDASAWTVALIASPRFELDSYRFFISLSVSN